MIALGLLNRSADSSSSTLVSVLCRHMHDISAACCAGI